MTSSEIVIKDDNGDDYTVPDIKSFNQHLLDYHAKGHSVHVENGHSFTVTDEFRSRIAALAAQAG